MSAELRFLSLSWVLLVCPACGAEDGKAEDATRTPSMTTTPEGGTAPSETLPSEPGPARGAFSVHVRAKGTCSVGDTWLDVPEVAGEHPVTATSHQSLAEHLTRDAQSYLTRLTCEWLPTQDPYQVLLGISRNSDTANGIHVSMLARLGAAGPHPSRLTIQRSGDELQYGTVGESALCDVTTLEADLTTRRFWGSLSCRSLQDREQTEECEATEGYFYFENCSARQ